MDKRKIMEEKKEIVLFETTDRRICLPVSIENDTVWLSANQMALLFERDEKTIRKHINNVFADEELEKENNTQKLRVDGVKQPVRCLAMRKMIHLKAALAQFTKALAGRIYILPWKKRLRIYFILLQKTIAFQTGING